MRDRHFHTRADESARERARVILTKSPTSGGPTRYAADAGAASRLSGGRPFDTLSSGRIVWFSTARTDAPVPRKGVRTPARAWIGAEVQWGRTKVHSLGRVLMNRCT